MRIFPASPEPRQVMLAAVASSAGLFVMSGAQFVTASNNAALFLACAGALSLPLASGAIIAAAGAALAATAGVIAALIVRPRTVMRALALGAALAGAVIVLAPDPPCPAVYSETAYRPA